MAKQREVPKLQNADTLPFLMDHLPDFFRKKSQRELNETPKNRVEILKEMKELIITDKSLKYVEFSEDYLVLFLRHITKKDFSKFKGFTVLPMRSPDGCAIILAEYCFWDPEQMSIGNIGRMLSMTVHQCLRDPMTQINGLIVIKDMKNMSLKALKQFTPYYMYLMYQAFVACSPARYKEFHIVNEPIALKMIWNVFKTFLPEKLRKRVFFHSSPEGILEHLPGSVIPSQYGGDLEDYYMSDWMINAGEQFGKCSVGGQANYY